MINLMESRRIFPAAMLVLITAEIFYFSSISGSKEPGSIGLASVAYHFTVFFLFSFFLFALVKGKNPVKAKHMLLVAGISVAHAILDEIHQMFVPFRDAGINDVLTNTLGIFSSMILYIYISFKKDKITQQP